MYSTSAVAHLPPLPPPQVPSAARGSSTCTGACTCGAGAAAVAAAEAGASCSGASLLPLLLGGRAGAAAAAVGCCSRWALVRTWPALLINTPEAQLLPVATATTPDSAAATAGSPAAAAGSAAMQGAACCAEAALPATPPPLLLPSLTAPPLLHRTSAAAAATAAAGAARASSTWAAGALSGGSSMPTSMHFCFAGVAGAAKTGPPSIPGLQRRSDSSSVGASGAPPLPALTLLPGTTADRTPVAMNPPKCCGARAPKGAPTAVNG